MIKTKNGRTEAMGGRVELLNDFTGSAEALLRNTKITAEELHEAVEIAEMVNEVVAKIGTCFDDFGDEEPETENEPEKSAEAKIIVRKDGEKLAELEGDDVNELQELLKGEFDRLMNSRN